jgi:alkylation response protein AidB-like acyl-CoA dehydrogenase
MTATAGEQIRKELPRLGEDEQSVHEAFDEFFRSECPVDRVREAEPLGYDETLWRKLLALGGLSMGLPEAAGGDGADLAVLAIVAEAQGRAAAPVPFIESAVATRLLAASGAEVGELLAAATSGESIVTVALLSGPSRQLVPAGAIATAAVALVDGELVLLRRDSPGEHVPNQGRAPLAWWDLREGTRSTLASGEQAAALHATALREWRLLTAAALVGMAQSSLKYSLEFVKSRTSFGVPLGTFQAVSHKLADVQMATETAQVLCRKAAWFETHEPGTRPELVPMAFVYATETATLATRHATRVQGGLGFTIESSTSLFFRRAKGWSVLAGDPQAELLTIGDHAATAHDRTPER